MSRPQKDPTVSTRNALLFFGSSDAVSIYEGLEDAGERVNFVYHLPIVQGVIRGASGNNRAKSAAEAKRFRDLGNQAYKRADDAKALQLYNVSSERASARTWTGTSPHRQTRDHRIG